jgi:hypothetical protein
MKTIITILLMSVLVCGLITGCGTTGFAGARQQTVTINVRFEGDIAPDAFAGDDGASSKSKGAAALVSISTGEMSYDGTRGDLGGTKAITGKGDANAASTRTIDLPNSGGAGTVDMAGGETKEEPVLVEDKVDESKADTAPEAVPVTGPAK